MDQTLVVFPTKHKKEAVVAPIFQKELNWKVIPLEIDTDYFGTFSGEIPRTQSPEKTALLKAQKGIKESGLTRAIASEGSIGPLPIAPFINSDLEIMVFLDLSAGIQIIEKHVSLEIVTFQEEINSESKIELIINNAGLPSHAVILRDKDSRWVKKGLNKISDIKSEINNFFGLNPHDTLIIESDFRAMYSASRMKNIEACAKKLAQRLKSKCPKCSTLGWGVTELKLGLPCSTCNNLVEKEVKADIYSCVKCDFKIEKLRSIKFVDPSKCNLCNP